MGRCWRWAGFPSCQEGFTHSSRGVFAELVAHKCSLVNGEKDVFAIYSCLYLIDLFTICDCILIFLQNQFIIILPVSKKFSIFSRALRGKWFVPLDWTGGPSPTCPWSSFRSPDMVSYQINWTGCKISLYLSAKPPFLCGAFLNLPFKSRKEGHGKLQLKDHKFQEINGEAICREHLETTKKNGNKARMPYTGAPCPLLFSDILDYK